MRLALVLVCLSISVPAQTRRDDFTPGNAVTTQAQLEPLPDGGCAVRGCGELVSDDGGTTLRACTQQFELQTAPNRSRCAALLDTVTPRVLNALRFNVDGGAP